MHQELWTKTKYIFIINLSVTRSLGGGGDKYREVCLCWLPSLGKITFLL